MLFQILLQSTHLKNWIFFFNLNKKKSHNPTIDTNHKVSCYTLLSIEDDHSVLTEVKIDNCLNLSTHVVEI